MGILKAIATGIDTLKHKDYPDWHPVNFGLPDLKGPEFDKKPGEPNFTCYMRRANAVKDFVEGNLKVEKGGNKLDICLFWKQLQFITDCFYGEDIDGERVKKAILWKNRGGGGSLCVAIILFLRMIYDGWPAIDMGGCLLPNTLVFTSNGIKQAQDVCVGDNVWNLDGEWDKVKAVHKKQNAYPVTKITPYGWGRGHEFTSDHRIFVKEGVIKRCAKGHLSKQDVNSWHNVPTTEKSVGEIDPNSDVLVVGRPKKSNISVRGPKICLNENGLGEKTEIDFTPELARWVGYYLAEGSTYEWNKGTYVQVDVSQEDEWLDDFVELTKNLFNRKTTYLEPNAKTKEAKIKFGCKSLAEWLKANVGSSCYDKKIPHDWIVGLSEECLLELLKGYYLGDGCKARTNRGSYEITATTASSMLSTSVTHCFWRLGIIPRLSVRMGNRKNAFGTGPTADHWQINVGSFDGQRLANEWFGAKIKKVKFRTTGTWIDEDHVYFAVRKKELGHYVGEVYDFTVNNHPSFALPCMTAHNSLEQAKQVYSYTTYFWECLPKLSKALLDGVPRRTETKLKNGCSLQCIPASEKQSRSKHVPLFVADEACQKDDRVGEFVNTAIQGVYSEPEHLIIWVSTFHVATGYFQDLVDNAEQYGIKIYYWNVFDAMEECNVGKEHATDKDPNAKKYCMEKCPLTRRERKYDEDGNFTHIEYNWCCGVARRSNGFFTYENVLDSMRNSSGDTFHVEHACNRPVSAGPVYHPEHVKGSFVNVLPLVDRGKRELREKASKIVGIDWGWTGETSVVGPIHFTGETLEIPKTMYFSGVGVEDLSIILEQLRNEFGDFGIYCDSSHPFVIDYLMNHGWEIVPVSFKKWKEYGIGNVARWLARKKIKISKNDTGNLKLKTQLLLYYRDKNGKPNKKDDHGPDALMCGVLNWNFLDYFSESDLEEDDDYLIEEEVPEESYDYNKVPVDEKNVW